MKAVLDESGLDHFVRIPDTVQGMDQINAISGGGYLLAELPYVAVDGSITDGTLIAVEKMHQLIARIYPARLSSENAQQSEFKGRQIELYLLERRLMAFLVQKQELSGFFQRRWGAAA